MRLRQSLKRAGSGDAPVEGRVLAGAETPPLVVTIWRWCIFNDKYGGDARNFHD